MSVIRSNEKIGRRIEKILADKLNGTISPSRIYPYDIETLDKLIEVKSCKVRTKGYKTRTKQYLQKGRFIINLASHFRFKIEADKKEKEAFYIFVIYEIEQELVHIKEIIHLSWKETNSLLVQGTKFRRRKDNMKYIILSRELITRYAEKP